MFIFLWVAGLRVLGYWVLGWFKVCTGSMFGLGFT